MTRKPARPRRTTLPDRRSPVVENYLSSLYKLAEEGVYPTTAQLADYIRHLPPTESLGASLPTVLGVLRRLAREELVEFLPTKAVRLTQKGLQAAEAGVRKHRLAECMVVQLFGISLQHACAEGHLLEHGISDRLEQRIQEALGSPTTSPYGRPVPGSPHAPPAGQRTTLREAVPGKEYKVDWIPEADQELIGFLADHGVVPDAHITVVEAGRYRGVVVFRTEKGEGALGYETAAQVRLHSL